MERPLINILAPALGYLTMLWLILRDRKRLPTSTDLEAVWRKRRMLATGVTLTLALLIIPLFFTSLEWMVWAYYAVGLGIGAIAVTSLAVHAARVAAKHTSAIR